MNHRRRFTLLILISALLAFTAPPGKKKQDPEFISIQNKWVDSVFNSLNAEERMGQLFMVAAYSNRDMKHVREIKDLIVHYNIGGLIWMQGGPVRQGKLANYYQSFAKTPLLYSIDAEWGLSMRLDSTPRYPRQMTLGAIRNDSLIYSMGKQIAKECKRLGIHVNFAPVADVNNNPLNPVIGIRSFGEHKQRVAEKAYMYMKGMQDEHVMANAKHFPGHGDTDADSHKSLPFMTHSRQRFDSVEFYPFRYLFDRGIASVMVAHLNVPALDTSKDLPSTLSKPIVTDLLKNEMGYKGLIFTDALNMKGVADFNKPGLLDVKALMAGNDMLLFSADVPKAIEEMRKAVKAGQISQQDIDQRCKKILQAKYWCGLSVKPEIVTRNITAELNTKESETLNDRLAEAAVTVLKNENNFLPIRNLDSARVAEISFGVVEANALGKTLKNYGYVEHIGLAHDAKPEDIKLAFERIAECDLAIVQVNKSTVKADNNYGVGNQTLRLIDSIATLKPAVLVMMTNPYLFNRVLSVDKFKAVIVGYEYMPSLLRATANVILGAVKADGTLPVSTKYFKEGDGVQLKAISSPAAEIRKDAFVKKKFSAIDSIALSGITEKAYPGCQVVAMKDGKLIYQKSFGRLTYSRNSRSVDNGTMYDLASITKIAASSLALMRLNTEGVFDYRKTLGDYLPYLKGSNKEGLVIEDVLSHQAGLQPWIPFYMSTFEKNGSFKQGYYAKKLSDDYPIQVARNLYAIKGMKDSVYRALVDSKLGPKGKYVYSDLGYYFMQQIIEQLSGKPLNEYVQDMYSRIGVQLTYRPLNYFSRLQVAPTENDDKFRKQVVHGYVHDPGAALLGGVAGHAGLFGNALEVAKLMQMFLNKGELNGVRLIDSNVVKDFTSCHFCPGNRRGLCFEKPEPDLNKDSPVTSDCSLESFGHSGFTGTFAWADPKNNLVVIFLSNRVFPSSDDNKLVKLGIRGNIHKAFYDALKITE